MKKTIIILAFILGFMFCSTYRHEDLVEGFSTNDCPNLLIKRGKELYLLNKKKAKIPGINPIKFKNLEDYAEYLQWQRRKGVRCPVLLMEEQYDTQNNRVYKFSNNPFESKRQKLDVMRGAGDIQIGNLLDARTNNNETYNKGGFPAYDPDNQNIGRWTPLDNMFHSKDDFSDNPMDTNWRGRGYKKNKSL